jgi:hypothetical protein
MSSLELVVTLLCFGAALTAAWFAHRALLTTDANAINSEENSQRDPLAEVGEIGTASSDEVRLINETGVEDPDILQIGAGQASILQSCADYIDTVWEKEPSGNRPMLSKEDREAAINLIFERTGYLERVVTWRQARMGAKDLPVPHDACQSAVAYLLMERTQHRAHH